MHLQNIGIYVSLDSSWVCLAYLLYVVTLFLVADIGPFKGVTAEQHVGKALNTHLIFSLQLPDFVPREYVSVLREKLNEGFISITEIAGVSVEADLGHS